MYRFCCFSPLGFHRSSRYSSCSIICTTFSSSHTHLQDLRGSPVSKTRLKSVLGVLEKVDLAGLVLGVARVELDNVLESTVPGGADVEGLLDNVEGDALVAGRGSERASIAVDVVGVEVADEGAEVESAGGGGLPAVGDVADAGKDGLNRSADSLGVGGGHLKEESNNHQGVVCEC